jgi:hypothetical protein
LDIGPVLGSKATKRLVPRTDGQVRVLTFLTIELPDGNTLTFVQAATLVRHIREMGAEGCHWHMNDCGCCVTLHGSDCAYVIGPDGGETFYAERGCGCEP